MFVSQALLSFYMSKVAGGTEEESGFDSRPIGEVDWRSQPGDRDRSPPKGILPAPAAAMKVASIIRGRIKKSRGSTEPRHRTI
jgi:hypothetical protein